MKEQEKQSSSRSIVGRAIEGIKAADRKAWKYYRGGGLVIGIMFVFYLAQSLYQGLQTSESKKSENEDTLKLTDHRPC